MPTSGGFIHVTIKMIAKCRHRATAMLLFYIEQSNFIKRSCIFFQDLLPREITRPYTRVRCCRSHLRSTSHHNVATVDGRTYKYKDLLASNCMTFVSSLMKSCPFLQAIINVITARFRFIQNKGNALKTQDCPVSVCYFVL
jgi:hypothetical protein